MTLDGRTTESFCPVCEQPPAPTREWVVGFLMDDVADAVILIRKNRPEWQAGKLNGVGGKVEPGEALVAAMVREFEEETGVLRQSAYWDRFASLQWEEGVVHFFRSFAPFEVLESCRTVTDEHIERHRIHTLIAPGPGRDCVTPNLLWLVPLAAHRHDTYDVIDVVETGTTMRKPGRLDVHVLQVRSDETASDQRGDGVRRDRVSVEKDSDLAEFDATLMPQPPNMIAREAIPNRLVL